MSVAAKNNYQEYDPRHRLTGAVVLILLAIILLPMLLSKKTEEVTAESGQVVMEVTKQGGKVFVSRISSHTENSPAQVQPAADTDKAEKDDETSALFSPIRTSQKKSTQAKAPVKKDAGKQPAAKQKAPQTKKAKAAPTTTKKTSTSTKSSKSSRSTKTSSSTLPAAGDWVLQVGVFSQSENARKKVSELKKKGFSARSGKVKTSKGTATKVWIGPFKDRKSAEKMQERLQHKTRQRGLVVKIKS